MGKPAFLHTQASGDFTLMAREHWFNVRGYAELDMSPTHLDALLCYAAAFAGAREEVLPYRVDCDVQAIAGSELPAGTINRAPRVLDDEFVWLVSQMRVLHAPLIFNLDHWGLAELSFSD